MLKDTAILIPARNESESLRRLIPLIGLFSQRIKEIVVVVDTNEDSTLELKHNITLTEIDLKFIVSGKSGIAEALKAGVENTQTEFVLVCMADEILPLLVVDDFIELLINGAKLVSATRYQGGGRRYGGSLLGHVCSKIANLILFRLFSWGFSDATSGMKAFRKSDWDTLSDNISYGGWAPALALARNAKRAGFKTGEVPVISVDRVIGGRSSFRLWRWIQQYVLALFGKGSK